MVDNQSLQDQIADQVKAKQEQPEGSTTTETKVEGETKTEVKDETKIEGDKKPEGDGGEKKEEEKTEEGDGVIKITAKKIETKQEESKAEDEVDEAKLLEMLAKKTGKTFTSLDEVLNPKKELTEEDKQKAKEKRDADKVAYGLKEGLISDAKLASYHGDTKNKKDLVFEQYWQDASAEDKTLTRQEAETEFNEKFGLDGEEDSRKYKRGIKEINALADQIIRNKYPEIYELESKFAAHETSVNNSNKREAEILQKAPLYKKDVEAAVDEIKSLTISRKNEDGTTESYPLELEKDILQPYKDSMLEKAYAENKIINGWDKEQIKASIQGAAVLENLDTIIFSAIDAALLKRQKGLQGIKPEKQFTASQNTETATAVQNAKADIEKRLQGTKQETVVAN